MFASSSSRRKPLDYRIAILPQRKVHHWIETHQKMTMESMFISAWLGKVILCFFQNYKYDAISFNHFTLVNYTIVYSSMGSFSLSHSSLPLSLFLLNSLVLIIFYWEIYSETIHIEHAFISTSDGNKSCCVGEIVVALDSNGNFRNNLARDNKLHTAHLCICSAWCVTPTPDTPLQNAALRRISQAFNQFYLILEYRFL